MCCVDVNTQFIGLSRIPVIFGESVYISVWPLLHLIKCHENISLNIHCLFNNGQQDANKSKTKATNKFAIKITRRKKKKQMQCSSFGRLLFVIKRLFSFLKKKNHYQDKKLDWLKSESKC